MKVLFAGGGTAGHINPALAIANYIAEKNPDTDIGFVGTKEGLEVSLVPHSGYPIEYIKVHGFERKISLGTLKAALELPKALLDSSRIIKKFNPDIVIGTGGYVCGPVLLAAAKKGIPTLVHESNAFPGITTKLLASSVDTVAVGIEAAKDMIKGAKKVVFTGSPVRPPILKVKKSDARRKLNLDERPFILIFGGSLGARDFNSAIAEWIVEESKHARYRILMGTGKNGYADVIKKINLSGVDLSENGDIMVKDYIYDMDIAMNAADIVISRAGASTLSELTAIGKPAILVPSPYVADNHQEHNARAIEKGGGAKVIMESELNADSIEKAVSEMTENSEKLSMMSEASRKMGVPDSTEIIYKEIMSLI